MDVAVPHSQEEIVELVQFIPQEMKNRIKEYIVDVPVHQIQEGSYEVITSFPQERTSERNFEQIIDVPFVASRRNVCQSAMLSKLLVSHLSFNGYTRSHLPFNGYTRFFCVSPSLQLTEKQNVRTRFLRRRRHGSVTRKPHQYWCVCDFKNPTKSEAKTILQHLAIAEKTQPTVTAQQKAVEPCLAHQQDHPPPAPARRSTARSPALPPTGFVTFSYLTRSCGTNFTSPIARKSMALSPTALLTDQPTVASCATKFTSPTARTSTTCSCSKVRCSIFGTSTN